MIYHGDLSGLYLFEAKLCWLHIIL